MLASRSDTALSATGLGRRAWDPLPPPPAVARSPVVRTTEEAEWIVQHKSDYVRVCALRGPVQKLLKKHFEAGCERLGDMFILGPRLERSSRATLLNALALLNTDAAKDHLLHVIARCCMRSEALAHAACPAPTGHRDWRDAIRTEGTRTSLAVINGAIDATVADPCAEATPQAVLSAQAARVSEGVASRVNRWMTVAEAHAIIFATASAACAAVALSRDPIPEKQASIDLIAAVRESKELRPLVIRHGSPVVSAFLSVRDAVASALYDEPLDEHTHSECIGGNLVAASAPLRETKRGGVRMATKAIRQELQRISTTEDAKDRLLVEPAQDLLVAASDYVSRAWLCATPAVRSAPSEKQRVPLFVWTFPYVTPADAGVRPEKGVVVSVCGRRRGDEAPDVTVHDARQAASVDLPPGTRVLLACFGDKAAPVVSGKELRLRLQCRGANAITLHSEGPVGGGIDAVALSMKGAFARVHTYDEGTIDALLLFLPPRAGI